VELLTSLAATVQLELQMTTVPPCQVTAHNKAAKSPSAQYNLTGGAEPKLDVLRERLTVYRDVYLKNPSAHGKKLLDAVEKHYQNRKDKRFANIPSALILPRNAKATKVDRVLRNLRRYIADAKAIVLNVAGGEFPGKY
jgi:hypothetical protein